MSSSSRNNDHCVPNGEFNLERMLIYGDQLVIDQHASTKESDMGWIQQINGMTIPHEEKCSRIIPKVVEKFTNMPQLTIYYANASTDNTYLRYILPQVKKNLIQFLQAAILKILESKNKNEINDHHMQFF